ncbi:MAG TPA: LLM class flavin-dependent oxidoreductase [Blastocatellia bacterium]|nr:LLM class flavin-dependent oxidoreductase [Blastocatellia bacterium]
MRYGFVIPGAPVRDFGRLAAAAEGAGWDAVFVPDALAIAMGKKDLEWFDPWVVLASMAVATNNIRIGTFLTPVPRRRPWKLAREIVTLDHLSSGRVIFCAGLGAAEDDAGFFGVGEPTDLKIRAELLDEGLEIITGLWKGKRYSFAGRHYKIDKTSMLPRPFQTPRVPIWVVGVWPKEKSMRRALRFDGLIPQMYKGSPGVEMQPDVLESLVEHVRRELPANKHYEIIFGGFPDGKSRKKELEKVQRYEHAGATWWVDHPFTFDSDQLLARIRLGPPKPR